jgi:hypothetical protein
MLFYFKKDEAEQRLELLNFLCLVDEMGRQG